MAEPELTPEQEARVRSLLADARHQAPIPAEVAVRLDRVLDQLAGQSEPAKPVDELAARRRRRRTATGLLAAAAAVVVVGVGIGSLVNGGRNDGGGGASSSAQGSSVDHRSAASRESDDGLQPAAPLPSSTSSPTPGPTTPFGSLESQSPAVLRSRTLAHDVRAAAREARTDSVAGRAPTKLPGYSCPSGTYGPGTQLPVRYDGRPAVLVLRPPVAGRQQAVVLACGTAQRLDGVVLTRP